MPLAATSPTAIKIAHLRCNQGGTSFPPCVLSRGAPQLPAPDASLNLPLRQGRWLTRYTKLAHSASNGRVSLQKLYPGCVHAPGKWQRTPRWRTVSWRPLITGQGRLEG